MYGHEQMISPATDLPVPARPLAPHELSEGYFTGAGGVRLYRCHVPAVVQRPGEPVLVLMHGYGEHCRRYDELARFLARRGISVASFDARGHGRSSGQRGYVREFEDYVDDLCVFFDSVVRSDPERSVALLGHSNGGLSALLAVARGALAPRALVLCNPLVELHARRRPVPDWTARLLSRVAPRLPLPSGISARDRTHDPELIDAIRRDRFIHGVATPRWYWSMLAAGRLAQLQAKRLRLPTLMIASELDTLVEPKAVKLCYERMPARDKRLCQRAGAFHEALHELDREALFAIVADWLEPRLCPEPGTR
jgi:alpha-beta hydrolase superfamily lysophospholipase